MFFSSLLSPPTLQDVLNQRRPSQIIRHLHTASAAFLVDATRAPKGATQSTCLAQPVLSSYNGRNVIRLPQ
jgi:hypothetical protein